MSELGWGLGGWGHTPWGFGLDTTLSLVSATPLTIRSISVELSVAPLATSPIAAGDALNPRTWVVTRVDTGEVLPVWSATMTGPTSVALLFLRALPSFAVQLSVRSDTLKTAAGVDIAFPRVALLQGLGLAPAAVPGLPEDLRSLPAPTDVLSNSLVVSSGGDYERHSGVELLRKLIIRRLTSTAGEWAAWPGYGTGLQVKRPLLSRDMPALAAQIQQQIELEPEVEAAMVSLSYNPAAGVLVINYKVRTVSGAEVNGKYPENPSAVTT